MGPPHTGISCLQAATTRGAALLRFIVPHVYGHYRTAET